MIAGILFKSIATVELVLKKLRMNIFQSIYDEIEVRQRKGSFDLPGHSETSSFIDEGHFSLFETRTISAVL